MISTKANMFTLMLRLRKAILSGELRNDNSYVLDFINFPEENISVQLIETRGMFKTSRTFYKVSSDGNISVDSSTGFDEKVTISDLNLDVYENLCKEMGIIPFDESIEASIDLVDDTIPVVMVGGLKFILPTLHSGNATDIIRIAYKNADQSIDREEIKMLTGITTLINVKDVIRATIFSPSAALAPFMSTSPNSVTLNSKVLLSVDQLNKIRTLAI